MDTRVVYETMLEILAEMKKLQKQNVDLQNKIDALERNLGQGKYDNRYGNQEVQAKSPNQEEITLSSFFK